MSSAPAKERADGRIRRRVEHVMGMPISLALRGRHASSVAGDEAWQAVINELRQVDVIFSVYRSDSIINRFDRSELTIAECPAEVAEDNRTRTNKARSELETSEPIRISNRCTRALAANSLRSAEIPQTLRGYAAS